MSKRSIGNSGGDEASQQGRKGVYRRTFLKGGAVFLATAAGGKWMRWRSG